jgi:hypothetical protein
MPQSWEAHWPLPTDRHHLEAEQARVERIHRLGNLTLVTKKLNPRLSNGSWDAKRKDILEHSALALNRTLPDQWDEETIDDRGRTLAEVALSIWIGPAPDGMKQEAVTTTEEIQDDPPRTEPITTEDLSTGRLRIPLECAVLLPPEDRQVTVILRGTETLASWTVALTGDGDALGSLAVDAGVLSRLADVGDSLILSEDDARRLYVD